MDLRPALWDTIFRGTTGLLQWLVELSLFWGKSRDDIWRTPVVVFNHERVINKVPICLITLPHLHQCNLRVYHQAAIEPRDRDARVHHYYQALIGDQATSAYGMQARFMSQAFSGHLLRHFADSLREQNS